jgi:signal transduction histidine kinase/CheY-like chemotaxis protein
MLPGAPQASPRLTPLEIEVEKRFGVLPNFFRLASHTPEITANLWGFACFAYFDNPLPSLFKERLFVHLSRFCEVRYCIVRHVGFLLGLGNPAGDSQSHIQTVEDVIRLLQRPFPRGAQLESHLAACKNCVPPLTEVSEPDSELEEALFACAGHVFLQTADAPRSLAALKHVLGPSGLEHLNVFLAFVRTAHYWTQIHPELVLEEDVKQLLATHHVLAECLLKDPEARSSDLGVKLLDELLTLRESSQNHEMLSQEHEQLVQEHQALRVSEREQAAMARKSDQHYRGIFQTAGVSIWEQDFTEVKAAIDALKSSGVRDFRNYFNEHPEFIERAIRMTKIVDVNDATMRMLEAQDKSALLRSIDRVFLPTPPEVFAEELLAIVEGRTLFESETVLETLSGKQIDILFNIAFPQPDGDFQRVLVSNMDITARKRAEAERDLLLKREQAARSQAEEANRVKDEFLAVVSHELRTPLNAILGWANMLRLGQVEDEKTPAALETIERNARAQNQLINDLLDVSRIITGKLRLDVRPVDPVACIEGAIESLQPAAEAKEIRIQKVMESGVSAISGDPGRLQQVVWNLLSNAIKFTPRGGRVQVRLERIDSHVEIVVSDTGSGIQPEFLPFVFDRFRQADATTTRQHGGMGLGLSIVRHLVELHGGEVRVDSDGENQGATFTITLPLIPIYQRQREERVHPRASDSLPQVEHSDRLEGLKVLVVDDEMDTCELLNAMLTKCGAEVTTATSATRALSEIGRTQFDLVISDVGMPVTDGYELMQKIRKLPADRGGKVPAIALTAYARPEDGLNALRAGYQKHVPKPIEYAELITVMASLAGRQWTKET